MQRVWALFFVASLLAAATLQAWQTPPADSATAGSVSASALHDFIVERRGRIAEFQKLATLAEARGLKLWLWGGTAASFLHDSRWHLLAKAHPEKFRKGRLRDELDSIFRSEQDFDLATDGTTEQAHQLQRAFETAMPGLKYEVRSLIEADGDKDPLLSDDVLNQNSDTGSRGLILLTRSTGSVVTDLPALRGALSTSEFLRDGAAATLQYLVSPKHRTTRPFREGRNPELLSVVRFLIKACQFDLRIPQDSWKALGATSKPFHTQEIPAGRARDWLVRQGRKVVMHALDMRRSFALLDELGLRDVLLRLDPQKGHQSLHYWLTRRPLQNLPRPSSGRFPTAGEQKLVRIAHDAKSVETHEAITWNPTGRPNFFISDQGSARREGVYALRGDVGAHNNGFTIALDVDANALVGHDILDEPQELIIHHRDALSLAPVELTDAVDSWLEPAAFAAQMSRAYALTALERRIANGIEPVSPATREHARQLFDSMLDFLTLLNFPSEIGHHWDKYLHFLYWVAAPESMKSLERRLAALEKAPTVTSFYTLFGVWRKAFHDVHPSVGLAALHTRMNAFVDKTLAAIADDSIATEPLIAWHVYLRNIEDVARREELTRALIAKTVQRARALPRELHKDASATRPFGSFAHGFQPLIDDELLTGVPTEEISKRLVTRKLFLLTRDGMALPTLDDARRSDLVSRGGVSILRNFVAEEGLEASDLYDLTGVRSELWKSIRPILRANQAARDRVGELMATLTHQSPGDRLRNLLLALVDAPGTPDVPEASWIEITQALDAWMKEFAFKTEYVDAPETKQLLARWLHRLETALPAALRPPQLRYITEWFGRNYLRNAADDRFKSIFMTWPNACALAAEALMVGRWPPVGDAELNGYEGYYFNNDGRAGARRALTAQLTAELRKVAPEDSEHSEAIADEFLAAVFNETGPPTGLAFWRNFPVAVVTANRIFGEPLRRHWGLLSIGPDFTKGVAHLRSGFAEGQAIRAMVVMVGWDYYVSPVGPDRIDRVWRRFLHFRRIVPHLGSLLMPSIEKAQLDPARLAGWRKSLRRAAADFCAEELTQEPQP